MSRKVLAVGGSGQIVLHHYLQLFLLGQVDEIFDAVVVDTDETFQSIGAAQEIFELLRFGRERNQAFASQIPVIRELRPPVPHGQNLAEILSGRASLDKKELHPARAFFDEETLKLDLIKGLFARPAMSSAIGQEGLRSDLLRPSYGSNNVVVSSLIGGTGGGLTAPLIDIVRSYQVAEDIGNVKIRGVFFGQYFVPDEGRLESGVARLRSNELLVLKTMQDQLDILHSFYLVRPDRRVERDPEAEKRPHVPWPSSESHPTWQGVRALDFLLTESTRERSSEFRGKEFGEIPLRPTLKASRERLEKGVALVEAFVGRKILLRIGRETWIESIWGSGLTDLIALYWRIAIEQEGRGEALKKFRLRVQEALEDLWWGTGESYGLVNVFPEPDQDRSVRPKHIRNCPWPRDEQSAMRDEELFQGKGVAARRLAATLIFSLLSKGDLR